jgi:ferrous iron transport protein A
LIRDETESQYARLNREMTPSPFNPLLPLCQLPAGSVGRVRELAGNSDFCQRVREMGLGESTFVTKIGGSGPFVCQVNGTRVALSHGAAMCILVEHVSHR